MLRVRRCWCRWCLMMCPLLALVLVRAALNVLVLMLVLIRSASLVTCRVGVVRRVRLRSRR